MPLYKYCQSQHFHALKKTGLLRIGTLRGYRSTEQHGSQIGDPLEGFFPIQGHRLMPAGSCIPGGGFRFGGPTNVTMIGCGVMVPTSMERFLFCMSEVYTEELHQRLKDDPAAAYDCCYRIDDPIAFVQAISKGIADRAQLLGMASVIYRDGPVDFASPMAYAAPELVKARDGYAHLREVRAGWRPLVQDAKPFLINVPEVRDLCGLAASI